MSSSSPSGAVEAAGAALAWPALRASGVWELFGQRGRRALLTEGIRAWVERARAAEVDATIGVLAGTQGELDAAHGKVRELHAPGPEGETVLAVQDGAAERATIWHLSHVRRHLPELEPAEVFPYTPVPGTRAFREAWRAWLLHKSARVDDPARVRSLTTLPVATPGVSGALFTCGHLFLDPGDGLVVADKRWDGYDTTFANVLGARLVPHRLFTPEGALDLQDLEDRLRELAARQPRVTAILNFPNNPTGYTPTVPEVEELTRRVRAVLTDTGKRLILIFDDAYEGFVYDPAAYPVSPFYAFLGLHPLCTPVKCDGITKELLFWGGRLGALTLGLAEAPEEGPVGLVHPEPAGEEEARGPVRADLEAEWENKCSAVVRAIVSSPTTPVQALVARILRDHLGQALAERERMIGMLRSRRERLRELLDAAPARAAFRADPFNGGLFALLNLRRGSAQAVALRALREHRVGVVPLEDPAAGINALRVTYGSVPESQLERLVDALVASAQAS